jgi:hypothetical protein
VFAGHEYEAPALAPSRDGRAEAPAAALELEHEHLGQVGEGGAVGDRAREPELLAAAVEAEAQRAGERTAFVSVLKLAKGQYVATLDQAHVMVWARTVRGHNQVGFAILPTL